MFSSRFYAWLSRGGGSGVRRLPPSQLPPTPIGFYNGKAYDGFQTIKSVSPYGLYNMAGNVWQWTGNLTKGMHYRYMRGGSHGTYDYNVRVWSRNAAEPDLASPRAGFRCIRKKKLPKAMSTQFDICQRRA